MVIMLVLWLKQSGFLGGAVLLLLIEWASWHRVNWLLVVAFERTRVMVKLLQLLFA